METFCMVVLGGEYVTTYCWRLGVPTRFFFFFFVFFFCRILLIFRHTFRMNIVGIIIELLLYNHTELVHPGGKS